MLFNSKTCFLLSLRTVMGVKLLRAKWEIHNKVDWQKPWNEQTNPKKRIKVKSRNLLLSPKVHLLIMADPKYAALPGIVSSYDDCDNIIHTFWFKGNDFCYRLKLRIK